jgi:hypothetical protein
MDNVQKVNNYINILSSQTFTSYVQWSTTHFLQVYNFISPSILTTPLGSGNLLFHFPLVNCGVVCNIRS